MKVDKTNAFDLRGNPYELKKRSTKASGEENNPEKHRVTILKRFV
jgi:hypothetical protein